MEFLDISIVKFTLMCVAIACLAGWLIGHILPYFDKGLSQDRKDELKRLIAQLSADERDTVQTSIDSRRKIEAIKFFRAATNAGLLDAKYAIEYMIALQKVA